MRHRVGPGAHAPQEASAGPSGDEREWHVSGSARIVSGRRSARPTRLRAGVVAAVVVLLAACAPEAPEPLPDVTVTPTIEPERATAPEPTIPLTWPLTGVVTEEVAQRPAVAVKIENTRFARPQAGLEAADVVWETIVEFEVSRLVAVFHSQMPEEIGPIRSVRPMDIPIAAPLSCPIVFSGGQRGILNMVAASNLQAISHDAGADGLYRVSRRSAPHNVYGSLADFVAQADSAHSAPPPQQFAFALRPSLATAGASGTAATTLAFRLSGASSPTWTWDAAGGRWLRAEGSTPAMAEAGGQLSAVNVVAITAPHPASGFRAQGGASVPTYDLVGTGAGVVATGGKYVAVTWSKASDAAPMVLTLEDGTPVTLAPGNTWVELIPQGTGRLSIT